MSAVAAFFFGFSVGMLFCLLITLSVMAWYDWRDSVKTSEWCKPAEPRKPNANHRYTSDLGDGFEDAIINGRRQ